MTKLRKFLKKQDLSVTAVARRAGYSRKHVTEVAGGSVDPTRACIVAITTACVELTGQQVTPLDLFDLQIAPRRKAA